MNDHSFAQTTDVTQNNHFQDYDGDFCSGCQDVG